MPKNLKTSQLKAKINCLEQENIRLRTLFQITLDVAYQAVNEKEPEEKENLDE